MQEDKTLNIVEDIDAYFTNSSHGIYREIPISPNSNIDNINVSEQKSISNSGSRVLIKIGDPDTLVSGQHHYRISYDYHLRDKSNEFYYNIIGTQWDTDINNFSFNIEMPKPYDLKNFGLSVGKYGTVGQTNRVHYTLNDTKISGKSLAYLAPHEGVTVRIALPDDYFNIKPDNRKIFVYIILSILTMISYLMWFFLGKDKHVTPVVNFYPPEGLNSAEVELIYKGKYSTKGLVSLIIYLAKKGYLKIKDTKFGFELHKEKSYSTIENPTEKRLLEIIFGNKSNVDQDYLARSTTFYEKWSKLLDQANEGRSRIFYESSINPINKTLMILLIIAIVLLTIYTLFNYNISFANDNLLMLLFPTVAIIVLFTSDVKHNPAFILWALGFGGVPLITFVKISQFMIDKPLLIYSLICLVISSICMYHLPKRNDVGNRLLGNVLGFKKFLETVELERVESLVKENPNYCFDVLPYLYIFDLSNKWIKKFESLFSIPQDWYNGRITDSSFHTFTNSFAGTTVPTTTNGGVSTSSSSGGGGGFSGGGCGGGGGGSW